MTVAPLAYPPNPLPWYRGGLWHLTLHSRPFTDTQFSQTAIMRLDDAHGRQLTQKWNTAAQLQFSIDGHSQAAAAIAELRTEVVAWRYDDMTGSDVPVFRGVITQSEDQLSEQVHTVTITCHDYLAVMDRRFFPGPSPYTGNMQQDGWVNTFVTNAGGTNATSRGTAAYLPLAAAYRNPDGSQRTMLAGAGGTMRQRTYQGGQSYLVALDDMAKVIGGFDYDCLPYMYGAWDYVRVFVPVQGITRTDPGLVYGESVVSLTRSVNSADYGNSWLCIGNNGSSDPNVPQYQGTAQNTAATDPTQGVGLWQSQDNASDVNDLQTLSDKANGDLLMYGQLVPAYTVALRPDWYHWNKVNMGDVVPLVVQSGRLNVSTTVRIMGITYDIGDDGEENVSLDVGRPTRDLVDLLNTQQQDVLALTRR